MSVNFNTFDRTSDLNSREDDAGSVAIGTPCNFERKSEVNSETSKGELEEEEEDVVGLENWREEREGIEMERSLCARET